MMGGIFSRKIAVTSVFDCNTMEPIEWWFIAKRQYCYCSIVNTKYFDLKEIMSNGKLK